MMIFYRFKLSLCCKSWKPSPFFFYYCESINTGTPIFGTYFTSDPLWDGSECVAANNNCSTAVGQPWFYQQFPTAQQDDIEVRLCTDQVFTNEGVVVDQMQLFIQWTVNIFVMYSYMLKLFSLYVYAAIMQLVHI